MSNGWQLFRWQQKNWHSRRSNQTKYVRFSAQGQSLAKFKTRNIHHAVPNNAQKWGKQFYLDIFLTVQSYTTVTNKFRRTGNKFRRTVNLMKSVYEVIVFLIYFPHKGKWNLLKIYNCGLLKNLFKATIKENFGPTIVNPNIEEDLRNENDGTQQQKLL